MAPILPGHVKEQDTPPQDVGEHERGADAQHEREAEEQREGEAGKEVELDRDELGRCDVNLADDSADASCREVNPAEGSEADLAEKPKVLKVPFLPLLGLLGRITASSRNIMFTVDGWPVAPTLSDRAANMFRVGVGVAAGAVGIFFTESDAICRGPGVRLWKPPAPGHCCCCPPHCDHGSAGVVGAAPCIHGN